MMKDEIMKKLIEKTAAKLGIDSSTLSGKTNIKTDIDLKSIEMVGIISELEEEYDCYIKYTDLMHADTIEESAEIIAKQVE